MMMGTRALLDDVVYRAKVLPGVGGGRLGGHCL